MKTQEVFNKVANKYDLMNDVMSFGAHRYWKELLIDWLSPKNEMNIVDVAGGTAGYTVYDVFAGFEPSPNLRFTIGMSNITDKRYATHLNTTNNLDSAATRTDEPGRSLFGSINYEF